MNEQENNYNFSTPTPPVQQPTPPPLATSQEALTSQQPKKKNGALLIIIIVISIVTIFAFGIFALIFISIASDILADPATDRDIPSVNRDDPAKNRTLSSNPVSGTWNCASGTGSTDDRNNFKTTIELKPDMTFRYGQYGDLSNNHYGGTYTYKDEYKQTADGSYKYYMLSFDTDEYILGGVDTDASKVNLSDMEMGITETSSGKQAITIFVSTYNMYYCYNDD
jgi:hypothetical protein